MLAGTFASFWPVYSAEIQEKQGALKGTWGAEHGYHGSKSMNKCLQEGAPQVMYKMVYKPHEYYSQKYHQPKRYCTYLFTNKHNELRLIPLITIDKI